MPSYGGGGTASLLTWGATCIRATFAQRPQVTPFTWSQPSAQGIANSSFAFETFQQFFLPQIFSACGWIWEGKTYGGLTIKWTLSRVPLFLETINMENCFPSAKMKLFTCFLFLGLNWFTVQVNLQWGMWGNGYSTKYWFLGSTFLRKLFL